MTPFEFMASAFYILLGIMCLVVAAAAVYGAITGIYRCFKGERNGKGQK